MDPADNHHGPLPRYGTGDDEKTRPGVVLVDWNGDDEPTIHVTPLRTADVEPPPSPDDDDFGDFGLKLFRPRWHGVGRRPGAVALAVVLGLSVAIGVFAMLGTGEAQAEAANVSAPIEP